MHLERCRCCNDPCCKSSLLLEVVPWAVEVVVLVAQLVALGAQLYGWFMTISGVAGESRSVVTSLMNSVVVRRAVVWSDNWPIRGGSTTTATLCTMASFRTIRQVG
jgi:hypothetical protein